jgi:seryl-tRNA synthetase
MNKALELAELMAEKPDSDGHCLEAAAELRRQHAEIELLKSDIHSCHPGCTKAGCVNERLRAEIELLKATASSNYGRGHVDAHSMASARVEELEAEVEALKADRDSWMQQASDRVADAVSFAKEAESLRAEIEALKDYLSTLKNEGGEILRLRAEIEALRKEAEWQPIETAPDDMTETVAVRWVNSDGEECRELDYKEDGCWMGWHEHAEHVEIIGGHGVSYTPPYENWKPLPTPPKMGEKA